jgi:hypothetical protein
MPLSTAWISFPPIFTKLIKIQFFDILCTEFYTTRKKKCRKHGHNFLYVFKCAYHWASRHSRNTHVKILNTEFHLNRSQNMRSTGRNLFTHLSRAWLPQSRLSRNSRRQNEFFNHPNKDFHDSPENCVAGDTWSQTNTRTWSPHKAPFFHFIKNACKPTIVPCMTQSHARQAEVLLFIWIQALNEGECVSFKPPAALSLGKQGTVSIEWRLILPVQMEVERSAVSGERWMG